MLQESFESLQRGLLLHQTEFEKGQEARNGTLRADLSSEMQRNRREMDDRLKELTVGVQTKLEQNLKEGFRHFEKVQEHLRQAERQLQHLSTVGQSINELNSLLKLPHLRGNFGEALLERILNDLLPSDSYELQYQIVPSSTERVDAVIKYPNCVLPIDSKFPREQILPLFETQDPVRLELARKQLTEVMKTLARSIKEKYIRPEHGTSEMALLFVPSETLYFEMLRNPTLCEELAKHKVFAVSPNTLAVTLHAISIARGYYDMAKGVEKTMLELKKANQHFENFERRFDEVGTALGKAQTAFNVASTHLSRYDGAVARLAGVETEALSSVPKTLTESLPPLNT